MTRVWCGCSGMCERVSGRDWYRACLLQSRAGKPVQCTVKDIISRLRFSELGEIRARVYLAYSKLGFSPDVSLKQPIQADRHRNIRNVAGALLSARSPYPVLCAQGQSHFFLGVRPAGNTKTLTRLQHFHHKHQSLCTLLKRRGMDHCSNDVQWIRILSSASRG